MIKYVFHTNKSFIYTSEDFEIEFTGSMQQSDKDQNRRKDSITKVLENVWTIFFVLNLYSTEKGIKIPYTVTKSPDIFPDWNRIAELYLEVKLLLNEVIFHLQKK